MIATQDAMHVRFAEGKVTKLRREFKLALSPLEAERITDRLERAVEGERPSATQITSIYFDRPGYPLALRTLTQPQNCLKVRTKEYFPDVLATSAPRVVLEFKRERSGLTQKRRAWISRERLRSLMGVRQSFLPVLAVSYQRNVFQRSESWRVTVDHRVEFFDISPDLALSPEPVTRAVLGASAATEDRVIIEVKHLGPELPDWLSELGARRCDGYSKFARGMSRIHSTVGLVQGG